MYYHLVVSVRSTSHINEKRSACVGGSVVGVILGSLVSLCSLGD